MMTIEPGGRREGHQRCNLEAQDSANVEGDGGHCEVHLMPSCRKISWEVVERAIET